MRLVGYEVGDDADRLCRDAVGRGLVDEFALEAAATWMSAVGRFATAMSLNGAEWRMQA